MTYLAPPEDRTMSDFVCRRCHGRRFIQVWNPKFLEAYRPEFLRQNPLPPNWYGLAYRWWCFQRDAQDEYMTFAIKCVCTNDESPACQQPPLDPAFAEPHGPPQNCTRLLILSSDPQSDLTKWYALEQTR